MRRITRISICTMALALLLCLTMLVMSGTAFAQQCVDNRDGTVTDNSTGLMWVKESHYCREDYPVDFSGFNIGGYTDWRVPEIYELQNVFGSSCKNLMENAKGLAYWSSTTYSRSYTTVRWVYVLHGGSILLGSPITASTQMNKRIRVKAVRAAQ